MKKHNKLAFDRYASDVAALKREVANAQHGREVFRNAWHSAMAMAIDSEEDIKALKAEQHDDHQLIEELTLKNANQASSIALLQDEAKVLYADLEGTTTQLVQLRDSYEELQHKYNKREDVRVNETLKSNGVNPDGTWGHWQEPVDLSDRPFNWADWMKSTMQIEVGQSQINEYLDSQGIRAMPEVWMKGAKPSERIDQWCAMTAEGRRMVCNHLEIIQIYADLMNLAKGK